jgi:RNA polymerase sigma factor (sigma-70 family)
VRTILERDDDISDGEAFARSLAGAPDAFGVVFDRHYDAVHRYAQRRCGPRADDIASDTFLAAFRTRARWTPDARGARPWLLGIATNIVRQHARDEQRWLRIAARSTPEGSTEGWQEQAVDRVDAARRRGDVVEAIAALSPGDRDTLLLSALAGLAGDEVALALGVPPGTVASRLHRVRRILNQRLSAGAIPTELPSDA